MKLIQINTDHYIVVDDSKIKEGDWCLDVMAVNLGAIPRIRKASKHFAEDVDDDAFKITHSTQPLDERGYWGKVMPLTLTISEIKELIGEVDVEKRIYDTDFRGDVNSYKQGYNQALEDNKDKKYTDEDVINFFKWAFQKVRIEESDKTVKELLYECPMLQPKTSWEVEIVDGKLKLK